MRNPQNPQLKLLISIRVDLPHSWWSQGPSSTADSYAVRVLYPELILSTFLDELLDFETGTRLERL